MKIKNAGFTLIEVAVVVAVIGILAAIALPSFLNQVSNSKETEARKNLALVLRRQQEYYQEHGIFALTWDELALGLSPITNNYTYEVFSTPQQGIGILINHRNKDLRSYLGGVKMVAIRQQASFLSAQCKAIKQGDILMRESLLVGRHQIRCGRRVEAINEH